MEIKVNGETYNPLLKRKEIALEIDHKGEGTPQRFDVRKKMASKLGAKVENVFVIHLRTSTGLQKTLCSLQVYDDPATAASTVPEHIVTRNLPPEERAKKTKESKGPEAKAPKPAAKPEAKPPEEGETKPAAKGEPKAGPKPEPVSSKPAK